MNEDSVNYHKFSFSSTLSTRSHSVENRQKAGRKIFQFRTLVECWKLSIKSQGVSWIVITTHTIGTVEHLKEKKRRWIKFSLLYFFYSFSQLFVNNFHHIENVEKLGKVISRGDKMKSSRFSNLAILFFFFIHFMLLFLVRLVRFLGQNAIKFVGLNIRNK